MADQELTEAINQLAHDVRSLNSTATMIFDQLSSLEGAGSEFSINDRLERIERILNDILLETSA